MKKSSKKTTKSNKKVLIVIPEEDEGLLSNYGYTLKNSHENRIKAIKKSMKDNDLLKILRHLNALRTLQKANEKNCNKLDKDLKWVQKEYSENK